jgi:hypothetical protein
MSDFRALLDTPSIERVTRLQGFSALLNPEIQQALTEGGTLLVDAARANTWAQFRNPTGRLADRIYFWVADPGEVQVVVGVRYGHRREYSFKGPDSLGRMFPNDPAQPYLIPAVEDNEAAVQALFEAATNRALGRVAA